MLRIGGDRMQTGSTDRFCRKLLLAATLADALHQAGQNDEAAAQALFEEAEVMQAEYRPAFNGCIQ